MESNRRKSAGIVISDTDEETELQQLPIGTVINLKKGERHRLVGVDEWGFVAEIWQHTDPSAILPMKTI
jgi:mannose-6-phosphate isomerase